MRTMIIHPDSHLDHGLAPEIVEYIRQRFADREAPFTETFDLPGSLPDATCALYGPLVGDEPVGNGEVVMLQRGERPGLSRMVPYPARATRKVTVIAGPHAGEPCVLYTAFGGPAAPREPWDPTLTEAGRAESVAFWAQHALAVGRG